MLGMVKVYEDWLMQANAALHRMRCARADTMMHFSQLDPVGFVMMVDAMHGMRATISPEITDVWRNMKNGVSGKGVAL